MKNAYNLIQQYNFRSGVFEDMWVAHKVINYQEVSVVIYEKYKLSITIKKEVTIS